MSYEIVNNTLNGNLEVRNEGFDCNFISYTGACFIISLDTDTNQKGTDEFKN